MLTSPFRLYATEPVFHVDTVVIEQCSNHVIFMNSEIEPKEMCKIQLMRGKVFFPLFFFSFFFFLSNSIVRCMNGKRLFEILNIFFLFLSFFPLFFLLVYRLFVSFLFCSSKTMRYISFLFLLGVPSLHRQSIINMIRIETAIMDQIHLSLLYSSLCAHI